MSLFPFPKLEAGEFAVLQTDPRTGVTLREDGTWAAAGQAHYRIFDSLREAESFCSSALLEKQDTEWCIYDHLQKPVKCFRDDAYWQKAAADMRDRASEPIWRRTLRKLTGK